MRQDGLRPLSGQRSGLRRSTRGLQDRRAATCAVGEGRRRLKLAAVPPDGRCGGGARPTRHWASLSPPIGEITIVGPLLYQGSRLWLACRCSEQRLESPDTPPPFGDRLRRPPLILGWHNRERRLLRHPMMGEHPPLIPRKRDQWRCGSRKAPNLRLSASSLPFESAAKRNRSESEPV